LYYARDKAFSQEEIEGLLLEAFQYHVPINPPTLRDISQVDANHFYLKKKNIYFGLGDIKKIGEAKFVELKKLVEEKEKLLGKSIADFTWYEFLIHIASSISSPVVAGLVNSGAVDYLDYNISRAKKLFEYGIWRELQDNEIDYILTLRTQTTRDGLEAILTDTGRLKISAKRKEKLSELYNILNGESYSTKDTIDSIMVAEKEYLGCTITCEALDKSYSSGDTTCSEILEGKRGNVTLAVEILSVRPHIIKKEGPSKGQKMAFLQVKDQSGVLESVCVFSDKWKEVSALIYKGNIVMLTGLVSTRNNEYSLIVNGASQI
jgi:DNA polymerase III alpha subunit